VDKDAMTKACIEKAVNSYREDSAGTRKLCECATEKNYITIYLRPSARIV
jgi:hypothetical protein